MYLVIENNPNCHSEERVFSTTGEKRFLKEILFEIHPGAPAGWCGVASVDDQGHFGEATAIQVEDSSAGSAWLIFGGSWGIRLKPGTETSPWSLDDKHQRGLPFLVLDQSTPIKFL